MMCAGFFDRLHDGHKTLLNTAFSKSEKVTVFLCDWDERPMYSELMESFDLRKQKLILFLEENGYLDRAIIIDVPKPSPEGVIKMAIEHISAEGFFNGVEVGCNLNSYVSNKIKVEREKQGKKCEIVLIPPVLDKDGDKISSSKIREKLKYGRSDL